MSERSIITCLASEGPVPEEIQFLPPGRHTVTAWRVDGEKRTPTEVTVTVDAGTAERLQEDLKRYLATGKEPYIDFNHEEGRAAGWVEGIRWAGDDPQAGGVRARVRWTASGRAALEGRDYRMFSPAFVPGEGGVITGTSLRMGGLVNSPAFGQLKIVAANADTQNGRSKMTDQEMAAAIAAKDAEIAKLKETMEASRAEAVKARATALVEAAAADGRLPGKAAELQAKWVEAICATTAAETLLAALPKREAPGRVIQASAADRGTGAAPGDQVGAQRRAVAEYQAAHPGVAFDGAWNAVRAAQPALFA